MKVIYILHLTKPDGSTISFMNMLDQLYTKGVEPFIIAPQKNLSTDFILHLDNKGIKYKLVRWITRENNLRYDFSRFPQGCFKWIKRIINYHIRRIFFRRDIYKVVKQFNPDIIHTNVGIMQSGYNAANKYGIPHVWHLREYQDLDFGYEFYPSKDAFIQKLKQSNVITISKDILKHFNLESAPNACTIYNGIEFKANTRLCFPKDKYFLCASRVSKEKGLNDIVFAFAQFHQINPDFKLLIAGNGKEEYIQELVELTRKFHCESAVEFLGFRSDVPELMAHATALLVGSLNEGFGRMTAEACFAGCLVIGRNTGGTKEILESVGGYLFDTNEELITQMQEVSSLDEDALKNMVTAIQVKAVKKY